MKRSPTSSLSSLLLRAAKAVGGPSTCELARFIPAVARVDGRQWKQKQLKKLAEHLFASQPQQLEQVLSPRLCTVLENAARALPTPP